MTNTMVYRKDRNVSKFIPAILFMLALQPLFAQVSEIKGASSSSGSRGSGRYESRSGGGSFSTYFFINMVTNGMIDWQRATLRKRGEVPNALSLEVFAQTAIQPSAYYVFNPRVRGNWGIFLSDFRINYMVEESINGVKDLRTDDWQILGLNFINMENVTARISTGLMHEAFGDNRSFSESVFGLNVTSSNQNFGGYAEYRWANDFYRGTVPRRELSVFFQKKLFDRGAFHAFGTIGVSFQRYYSEIDVWGLQGGLAFKIYEGQRPDQQE